jgi:hypothetical protein
MENRVERDQGAAAAPAKNRWGRRVLLRILIILVLLALGLPIQGFSVGFVQFGLPAVSSSNQDGFQDPSLDRRGRCFGYLDEEIDCETGQIKR